MSAGVVVLAPLLPDIYLISSAAAFAFAYIAARKHPRKRTHIIAAPSCIITLACWGFIAVGVEMFISAAAEVTDTGKYEEILDDYWSFTRIWWPIFLGPFLLTPKM